MAFKLAEAFIELRANGLQTVTAQLSGLRGNLDTLGRTKFHTGVETGFQRIRSAMAGMQSAAAGLPAILGAGAIAAAGKHAVQLAMDYETATTSFNVMLGSMADAKRLMGQITRFAAETPFESPEVIQATKSLIAFGSSASTVIDEVRRLGDISSAVNMPLNELAQIYGKARVQGRLFAEDINQLTGRGIPIIGEIAKQLHITDSEVRKAVEKGQVNFSHIEKAFQNMTAEGGKFHDMMTRQSKTMAGIASTAKDDINSAFREMGDIIGHAVLPPLAEAAAAAAALSKAALHHPDPNGSRETGSGKEASEKAAIAKEDIPGAKVAELKARRKELQDAAQEQFAKISDYNKEEREGRFNTLRLAKTWAGFDEIQDAKNSLGDLQDAIRQIDARLAELGTKATSGKNPINRAITDPLKTAAKYAGSLPDAVNRAVRAMKLDNAAVVERAFGTGKKVKRGELGFEESPADAAALAQAVALYDAKIKSLNDDLQKTDISQSKFNEEKKRAEERLAAAKKQYAVETQFRTSGELRAAAEQQYKHEIARIEGLAGKKKMTDMEAVAAANAARSKRLKQIEEIAALESKLTNRTGIGAGVTLAAMKHAVMGGDRTTKAVKQMQEAAEAAKRLTADSATAFDRYKERMAEIEKAKPKLTPEQYQRLTRRAEEELDRTTTGESRREPHGKTERIAAAEREREERLADLDANRSKVGDRYQTMRQKIDAAYRNRLADIKEQYREKKDAPRFAHMGLTDFARNIQQGIGTKNQTKEARDRRMADDIAAIKKTAEKQLEVSKKQRGATFVASGN